jgi:hypothetical protein
MLASMIHLWATICGISIPVTNYLRVLIPLTYAERIEKHQHINAAHVWLPRNERERESSLHVLGMSVDPIVTACVSVTEYKWSLNTSGSRHDVMTITLHQVRHGRQDNHATNHVPL